MFQVKAICKEFVIIIGRLNLKVTLGQAVSDVNPPRSYFVGHQARALRLISILPERFVEFITSILQDASNGPTSDALAHYQGSGVKDAAW